MWGIIMMSLHFQDIEKNYIAHILKEIYYDKVYDPYFRGKKDLTVLDLGANIGLFSLYVHKFASTVLAVEPASDIYECLVRNIHDNELGAVITPVQAAIGGENGQMKLYTSDVNLTMASSHPIDLHNKEPEIVQKMGLFTLLNLHSIEHVDFMKLDIEGSEFELLASEEFLKAAPRIDFIMGEIHSWTGRNPQQCIQSLEESGYDVEIVSQSPLLFQAKRSA